ncbi:hypothetical protein FACS189490_11350 [Clostridia bacterium]|nr:hypothetical protein FACS189490_11350 [Clostridia bacterium]
MSEDTLGYIFMNLKSSENALKSIRRNLSKQAKFNKDIKFFVFASALYFVMSEVQNYYRDKRIDELSCEIEKLRREKGE